MIHPLHELLRPEHAEHLALFRIPTEILKAAGVRSVTDAEAREFGIRGDGDMSGFIIPYFDPITGTRLTARLRRDRPEIVNGKPERKYVCAFGDVRHLYFPPGAGPLLADVTTPIVFVESEKSALAITALAERAGRKFLVIAVGGCWGWRGKTGMAPGPKGEREEVRGPLPDLDRIVLSGRKSTTAFDSNVASNPKVRAAREAFAQMLLSRGAKVFLAHQPEEPGINGPDDYIAAHGDEALLHVLGEAKQFPSIPGVLASDVKSEIVKWLWENHIPLGKTTIFDGDPDEGKSLITIDLAARVTSGDVMPDGSKGRPPAGVVIVSLEDGIGDTIRPRLEAARADLKR